MIRGLKYIMSIFYANNNFAKYKTEGAGYFIAVIGTSFYIFITGFLFIIILSCISPEFYKLANNVGSKINPYIFGVVYMIISSGLLVILFNKNDIVAAALTKKQVNRAVNYLLFYLFLAGLIIIFLIMKYLRYK